MTIISSILLFVAKTSRFPDRSSTDKAIERKFKFPFVISKPNKLTFVERGRFSLVEISKRGCQALTVPDFSGWGMRGKGKQKREIQI